MKAKRSRSVTLKHGPPPLCAVSSHSSTSRTESCNSSSASELQTRLPLPTFCRASGKKKVKIAADDDGNALCTVFQIRSYREYEHLWWSDEELTRIKSECSDIAAKYEKNKQFCAAIADLLMNALQCEETQEDLDKYMKAMSNHGEVRGLEPHIVAPCQKLGKIHYDAVLDVQQEAYDNGFYGSDKANMDMSEASIQTSRPFVILALRQAQFDAREAFRAALTRWSSYGNPTVDKSKKPPSRRSSMSRIESSRSMSSTTFYSSALVSDRPTQSFRNSSSGRASAGLSQSEHKTKIKTSSRSKSTSSAKSPRRSSLSGVLLHTEHRPKSKTPSTSTSTSNVQPLRRSSMSGGLSHSEHRSKRKTPSRNKATPSVQPLRRSSIF